MIDSESGRANRSTRSTELKIKPSPGILAAMLTTVRGNLDKVPYTCNKRLVLNSESESESCTILLLLTDQRGILVSVNH